MAKEKNYKLNKADKQKSGLIIFSNFDPKPKEDEQDELITETAIETEIEKPVQPIEAKKSKKSKKSKPPVAENLDTNLTTQE